MGDMRFLVRMRRVPVKGKRGGGRWRANGGSKTHTASQDDAHPILLALSSFTEGIVEKLFDGIRNTTAMNIMKKCVAHSEALVRDPPIVDKALKERGVQPSCCHNASGENAADGI
ncbi:putative protein kinase, putative,serine/threonine protein kinase [Trypanosoma vivax]|nr:putative protein kinase, putative,serine/threonine protein kinase [Trypanosoma vivax]